MHAYLPEIGCAVVAFVAFVGSVVDVVADINVDVNIPVTTELTFVLQTMVLALCNVVDTGDK